MIPPIRAPLLVVQYYVKKWADAIPVRDQTAAHIKEELVKIVFRITEVLHSDQGQNFESTTLKDTLKAFGVSLVQQLTTLKGDSKVERLKWSLLQVLHTSTKSLPIGNIISLWSYIHCCATGISPFVLPQPTQFESQLAFDPTSYSGHIQEKLAQTNLPKAAACQKATLCSTLVIWCACQFPYVGKKLESMEGESRSSQPTTS